MSYTPETGITGMAYSGEQNYSYDDTNWKDKLTAVDGNAITYDAIGNPISYNGYTFTWEQGRQLDRLYGNGVYCDYAYDLEGLRTSKFYNGTTYNYTWINGQLSHQAWDNNYIHFYYDGDSIIGFNYNGTSYTYVKNIQGDVIGIVDNSGILVAEYEYDAWGKPLNTISGIGAINPIRYRGYYYDSEIGMYYLQSRYYDPSFRRFINEDWQINNNILGLNLFSYSENDPVNKFDPKGRDAVLLIEPDAAVGFGHVAVIFEAKGAWYYYSVAGKDEEIPKRIAIDCAYIGKDIAIDNISTINDLINKAAETHNFQKKDVVYSDMQYFEGNFDAALDYLYDNYEKILKDIIDETNFFSYNLISNNCLDIASSLLSKGTITGKYSEEYSAAIFLLSKMQSPNSAWIALKYFDENIERYSNASFIEKIFLLDPYYFFDNSISPSY